MYVPGASATVTETCYDGTFHPQCHSGDVILINSAQYGRMKLGQCIETDLLLGCSADVMPLIDRECSGAPTCQVRVDNSNDYLKDINQCPKDMLAYLEIDYTCLTGQWIASIPQPTPF